MMKTIGIVFASVALSSLFAQGHVERAAPLISFDACLNTLAILRDEPNTALRTQIGSLRNSGSNLTVETENGTVVASIRFNKETRPEIVFTNANATTRQDIYRCARLLPQLYSPQLTNPS